MLLSHNHRLETVGAFRQHVETVQIVSDRLDWPRVHFETLLSAQVTAEMARSGAWFYMSRPGGAVPPPALTRAGHLR
jgi:hypothetical protein